MQGLNTSLNTEEEFMQVIPGYDTDKGTRTLRCYNSSEGTDRRTLLRVEQL